MMMMVMMLSMGSSSRPMSWPPTRVRTYSNLRFVYSKHHGLLLNRLLIVPMIFHFCRSFRRVCRKECQKRTVSISFVLLSLAPFCFCTMRKLNFPLIRSYYLLFVTEMQILRFLFWKRIVGLRSVERQMFSSRSIDKVAGLSVFRN